jgi:poly(hydroxyalkanoate) granule-associated protein
MAKVEVIVEEAPEEEESGRLLEAARKVLLAGIGAVALTQETIEDFVSKLVERGEIAEKDGKKLVGEVMEKRKKQAEKGTKTAQDEMDKRVETILGRMNVPSKSDIDSLSSKITALTKKVDELKEAQSK